MSDNSLGNLGIGIDLSVSEAVLYLAMKHFEEPSRIFCFSQILENEPRQWHEDDFRVK